MSEIQSTDTMCNYCYKENHALCTGSKDCWCMKNTHQNKRMFPNIDWKPLEEAGQQDG